MPAPAISSFAKQSGKSEAEIEKLWDKAKATASKEYPDVAKDSDKYYAIVTGILKNMLGLKEETTYNTGSPSEFKDQIVAKLGEKTQQEFEDLKKEMGNGVFSSEDDIHEAVDDKLDKIADLVKGKNLVNLGKTLEGVFKKKDIDFVFSPVPHFRIKDSGKTLIIVNKKYADSAEKIVGEIAIGYEGKI